MLILLRKLFYSFQIFTSDRKLLPQEEFENLGEAVLVVLGVIYFRQATP